MYNLLTHCHHSYLLRNAFCFIDEETKVQEFKKIVQLASDIQN